MEAINNLKYEIIIRFVNDNGVNVSISKKMQDDGLEVNSVSLDDVCITEETICGRVLSGKYSKQNSSCGYRYDYEQGELLINLNEEIPLNTAINLINATKKDSNYLSAKLVLSSVSRGDYRVCSMSKGKLDLVKKVSAEDEKTEECCYQENISMSKIEGDETFLVDDKECIYVINNTPIKDDDCLDSNQLRLKELVEISNRNITNYKELLAIKSELQQEFEPINQ